MILTRVSSIETFRRWKEDEDASVEDLVTRLTQFLPTEAMLAGTAFHHCLEHAKAGEYECMEANGYTFLLPDAELALPEVRELRTFGRYGDLRVTGQVDALYGRRVEDHKTTASFNPDGYMQGYQWRFYLDLFGADVFRWNVFEILAVPGKEKTYRVKPPHRLEQCRYPGMHDDCLSLANEFHEFAKRFMPDFQPAIGEAASTRASTK